MILHLVLQPSTFSYFRYPCGMSQVTTTFWRSRGSCSKVSVNLCTQVAGGTSCSYCPQRQTPKHWALPSAAGRMGNHRGGFWTCKSCTVPAGAGRGAARATEHMEGYNPPIHATALSPQHQPVCAETQTAPSAIDTLICSFQCLQDTH